MQSQHYPVMQKKKSTKSTKVPGLTYYPSAQGLFQFDAMDVTNVVNVDRWRKEVPEAQRQAKLKRIVKKTIMAESFRTKYRSADGKPLRVEAFPLVGLKINNLFDFGCPVAVNLYLRFLVQTSILFALMFLVSLPDMASNAVRNDRRAACRALTRDASSYDAILADNASSCGWSGLELPIRRNLIIDPVFFLRFALGTCLEYTNATNQILPIRRPPSGDDVFVSTPNAAYCSRGDDALSSLQYWTQFLNVLLFFLFLINLRRVQRSAIKKFDRERWTTSDYAAVVTGLDRLDDEPGGVMADDSPDSKGQESKLWADLADMGIEPGSKVAQIEIGRVCKDEIRDISAYGKLKIRQEEIESKKRKKDGKGKPLKPKLQAELERVYEKLEGLHAKLEQHKEEPDVSTGHAFVVFLYEEDRNKFVRMCRKRWCNPSCGFGDPRLSLDEPEGREVPGGGVVRGGSFVRFARTTDRSKRMPKVDYAPEPDDIRWADLAVTEVDHALRVTKTFIVVLILLGLGFYLNFEANRFQARIGAEGIGSVASGGDDFIVRAYAVGSSLASSLIPVVVNLLLKEIILRLTYGEGHPTQSEVETALFSKLSLAYTFNTCVIPFSVGLSFSLNVSGRPVNQSWYEPGGVVNEVFFLMLSNAIFTDVLKLLQVGALINRCRGYLVVSQARLNQLWTPPDMNLGELYAASLKTAALCLIYAPLWPPAYLVSALAMFFSFWCTKCAVSVWYRRPPMMSEDLFQKMRSRLGLLMLMHTVVAAVGANAASSDAVRTDLWNLGTAATSPVAAMFALCVLYELLDAPGCLNVVPFLRNLDQGGYEPTTFIDGVPIPYHDTTDADGHLQKGVEKAMGYEIDQYICPTARESRKELTTDALIALVLRDYAFGSTDGADGNGAGGQGGTSDMRAIKMTNLHLPGEARHAHLLMTSSTKVASSKVPTSYPQQVAVELPPTTTTATAACSYPASSSSSKKKKKAPPIMTKQHVAAASTAAADVEQGGSAGGTSYPSVATPAATATPYPTMAAAASTPTTAYPSATTGASVYPQASTTSPSASLYPNVQFSSKV